MKKRCYDIVKSERTINIITYTRVRAGYNLLRWDPTCPAVLTRAWVKFLGSETGPNTLFVEPGQIYPRRVGSWRVIIEWVVPTDFRHGRQITGLRFAKY